MPMDPQLAAIYGTNADESDVEKLAAAQLAEDLADDEDVDPAELSDEQAEQLAKKVLEAQGAEEEGDEDADDDDEDEEVEKTSEAQEKLAEADYLGRVMAHSYVQELRKIASVEEQEKTAGKVGDFFRRAGGGAKKGAKGAWGHVKKHKKKYIGGGVGAAAAGAGGIAYAKHRKKKESSALDVLAERRALEILRENGIDPQQEKQSASEPEMEALQGAVEQRAYAMLQQAGYIQEQE